MRDTSARGRARSKRARGATVGMFVVVVVLSSVVGAVATPARAAHPTVEKTASLPAPGERTDGRPEVGESGRAGAKDPADPGPREVRLELKVVNESGVPRANSTIRIQDGSGADNRQVRTDADGTVTITEGVGPSPCNRLWVLFENGGSEYLGCFDGGRVVDRTVTTEYDEPIRANHTVYLTPDDPGSIEVSIDLNFPEETESFEYDFDEETVLASDGFETSDGESYSWDGSSRTASIRYRVAVNGSGSFGTESVDTGDWAFFKSGVLNPDAGYTGPTVQHDYRFVPDGVAGDLYIYVGPIELYERSGPQTFRFVAPAGQDVTDPTTVLERLDRIREAFDADTGLDDTVTVFAPTDPIRGGGAAGSAEFWVNGLSPVNISTSGPVWYHEYVHTRQEFFVGGTNAYWLTEATAEYYAEYLTYEIGQFDDDALREALTAESDRSAVLTEVSYTNRLPAYSKGAHVAAALDLKIRSVTGGRKTLADVFDRMNNHEEPQIDGFEEFKDIVESVAGRSLDSWLERYVNSSAIPSLPSDLSEAYEVNGAPTARTGGDRTVTVGTAVELDATGTTDPDGDPVSYEWTQTGGPSVSLQDGSTATPTFTAPDVDGRQTLTFEVTATDDGGNSDTATVAITVRERTSDPLTVTRTLDATAVEPGGTTTVTVTAELGESVDRLAIVETFDTAFEDVTLRSVQLNGSSTFPTAQGVNDGGVSVAFDSLEAGTRVTVTYEVTVGDGKGTTYPISGRVTTASRTVAPTDASVVVGGPVDRADRDGDGDVSTDELNDAIQGWVDGEYTTEEINAVVSAWVQED